MATTQHQHQRDLVPRCALWAVVCVAALSAPMTATASTVRPLPLHEIVSSSGCIVHGTVTGVETRLDSQSGLVCTWTTIEATEILKGEVDGSESTVTFKQAGGVLEGSGVAWGSPRVTVKLGQEAIVCLYPKSRWGFAAPVGLEQGVFRISKELKTGTKRVRHSTSERILFSGLSSAEVLTGKAPTQTERLSAKEKAALKRCVSKELEVFKRGIAELVKLHKGPADDRKAKKRRYYRNKRASSLQR